MTRPHVTTKLEKELDLVYASFIRQIEAIANREFEAVIKPWLIKKGYSFLAGNGTYVIWDPFGPDSPFAPNVDNDKLPAHIMAVLQADTNERGNGELGLWMPDFDYVAYYANEEGRPGSDVGEQDDECEIETLEADTHIPTNTQEE